MIKQGERRNYRRTVTQKMNLGFAAMLIAFSLFSAYTHLTYDSLSSSYSNSTSKYFDLRHLKETIQECDQTLQEYLRNGNRTNLAEHNEAVTLVTRLLRELKQQRNDAETRSLLQSLDDAFYSYQRQCNYASMNYLTQKADYYDYLVQAQNINSYMTQYCDDLFNITILNGQLEHQRLINFERRRLAINVLLLGGGFALFGVIVAYFNRNLATPLHQMYLAATRIAQGDIEVVVETKTNEPTIMVLSNAFNYMVENIKLMMENIRKTAQTENDLLQEKLKSSEYLHLLDQMRYQVLQAQVNPHFMFNTLNSISRTVTLGMKEAAISMIDALAALLRYNLGNINIPARLQEELESVEQYLKIQQYRFRDRIDYRIEYEESLSKRILMPRFTLQPLVENAVQHGLEPNADGGIITIRVVWEKELNQCIISVIDNGVGIREDRLELLEEPVAEGHMNSIGLKNTMERLRFFTGDKTPLTIESKLGVGTISRVILPIKEEDNV